MEPEVKENFNWKRLLITISMVVITAGIFGGVVWYLMNKNQKDIQASNDKTATALQKQIDDLNKKTTTATNTTNTTTTTATKDLTNKTEVVNFCATGNASILRGYYVVINDSGSFVSCNVGALPGSGHAVIGKVVDNKWLQIYTGQQVMSYDTANQYKVPSIIIGDDLTNAALIYPGYKNYQY